MPRKTAGFLIIPIMAAISTGSAQQLPEESTFVLDEYIIEGIRDTLIEAVEIKRESYQMLDVIIAENIGKFPDNNVVEALQRVSGVQVTNRGGGEVSTVSIRGLNDVTTTINGRNIFTASGRAVALADIPASLLNRVDIYKTRSPSLIETGIAGVIDIQTHKPFYFDGPRGVLAARTIYQEQSDSWDPNLSAMVSNVWNTDFGKIGALVALSYAETNYRDQSVTAGAMMPFATDNPPPGWTPYEIIRSTDGRAVENPIWQPGLEAGLPFAAGSTFLINGEPTPYLLSRDAMFASDLTGQRERPAANLIVQFAPDSNSEYEFQFFYNGYRNRTFNSLLFSFVDWWGALGENPAANIEIYPGTNIVKSRKNIGFPYGFMSGDLITGKTDSYLYAIGGKWKLNDRMRLRADLSYQDSEYNEDFFAMRTDRVAYSIDVDFNSKNGLPAFAFANNPDTAVDESDLADASQWNIAQLYDNANRLKGDAITATVDGDYNVDWGIFQMLNFGIRYDKRTASEAQRTQDAPGLGQPLSNYPELIHLNSGFFDGRSEVPTSWAVADGYAIRRDADRFRNIYRNSVAPNLRVGNELVLVENFNVDEATTSAYVQTDFVTYIGDRKLDGQFGVRYVYVDTDMNFTDQNTLETSSASANTGKALPSLVVRYDITDNLRARFSYGQTLRRPGFAALNPNIIYVEDVTNIGYGTATGGNPNLKPTESKNYDISLEWYFAPAGSVYATAFRRDIDGLVVDFRRRVTFENYDYILTQPDNASNGKLQGFEFGLVYFPDNLPDFLDGFGIQASYTILDSEQDIPITNSAGEVIGTDTTPFFAVSDSSYSVVLAYEKEKFSARLSYVWRKDFLNNYEAALFANPLGVYRKPETSMDFQFTYNVTENFVLTFDATNITNEIFQTYYQYPDTHNFGSSIFSRTFALGARYSF